MQTIYTQATLEGGVQVSINQDCKHNFNALNALEISPNTCSKTATKLQQAQ